MKLEAARQLIAKKLQSFRMEDGELVYHTLSFLVESEQGPFWKVYLLNPSVSYDDALYVLLVSWCIHILLWWARCDCKEPLPLCFLATQVYRNCHTKQIHVLRPARARGDLLLKPDRKQSS